MLSSPAFKLTVFWDVHSIVTIVELSRIHTEEYFLGQVFQPGRTSVCLVLLAKTFH